MKIVMATIKKKDAKSASPKSDGGGFCVNQTELAKMLGCTSAYISKITKDGLIQKGASGYNLYEVLPVLFKKKLEDGNERYLAAKIKRAEADAESAVLDLESRKRGLVPFGEALEAVRKVYQPTATAIRVLPQRLAPKMVGLGSAAEAINILTEETDKWQEQLKARITSLA